MKASKIGSALLASALLFAASAFAGETNKMTLRLQEKVTVEGKQLNPGTYKLEWDGSGPNVQVNILQGKDSIATVPARLVQEPIRNNEDAYATNSEPDGSTVLTYIYVGGKRFSLQFEDAQAAQPTNTEQGSK